MSEKHLSDVLLTTRPAFSGRDQTMDALKTVYRAVGLLADGSPLDTEMAVDIDTAERLSGSPVYAEAVGWYDGTRTDCLPPPHLLDELSRKLHA